MERKNNVVISGGATIIDGLGAASIAENELGIINFAQTILSVDEYLSQESVIRGADAISAGSIHACAIGSDKALYCWGEGLDNRLGTGSTADSFVPTRVANGASPGTFKAVSTGANFSCAISDPGSQLFCWGNGANGRLGNGSSTNQPTAVAVAAGDGPATYKAVVTGQTHSCAIGSDDSVYCWGSGTDGKIGDGFTSARNVPTTVSLDASEDFVALAAGINHTCAVAKNTNANV